MLFFQVLLTGGYAYAYWLLRRLRNRSQGIVHLLLLGTSLASLLVAALTWRSPITQEVAVIPFLRILPLTVYLLTFILAFSEGPWYSRRLYMIAYFILGFASFWMLAKWPPLDIVIQVILYLLLLFICCMICHSELFKLRPDPRFLPSFYLMIAVGGAVGGIFVTILAPYLFSTGFWELQ